MTLVQGATRGTLAGLALPNFKSYHRWHNTRLKRKGLQNKEREKGDKRCLKGLRVLLSPRVGPADVRIVAFGRPLGRYSVWSQGAMAHGIASEVGLLRSFRVELLLQK